MPIKPRRPCSFPGCPELTSGQYCNEHQKQITKAYDLRRGSAAQRGYDARWTKARKRYLKEHPLCVECLKASKLTPANVVDHIIPHRGDKSLFWNESNWQSLCSHHHNSKTAKEDGRWGYR
ncbi:HNH endonuclease [Desulfosporosinus sp. SB140]|uniref:HNH endonuclease n=1 Tax=Desulfosporosinus paludis TaxID=3115649 RepID=UPI0038901B68